MRRTIGFTLIELLVVVTIIVVLLALLVPAMDKAIYQAELAVCGTNLKAIATGGTVYATNNQRLYPNTDFWRFYLAMDLRCLAFGALNAHDVRPLFAGYIPIKSLLDPMVEPVDLDTQKSSWVQNSYSLWFGAQHPGHNGMRRLGDRWGWQAVDPASGQTRKLSFDLIASDTDFYTTAAANGTVYGSHPDALGLMKNEYVQDVFSVGNTFTFSYWQLTGTATRDRGLVDLNHAYADGSVTRTTEVQGTYDPRMEVVPAVRENYDPTWYLQVPAR